MTVLTAKTATTSTRSERPKGMAQRPQKWAVACQKRWGRPAEIDEKEVSNETLRTWQDRHRPIQQKAPEGVTVCYSLELVVINLVTTNW